MKTLTLTVRDNRMNKAFEKILERLQNIGWVYADYYPNGTNISRISKKSVSYDDVIKIVQEVAEEYNSGWMWDDAECKGYNKAIDDFAERLKPIIDEKIKGWTNSDDLRIWCERSIDEISEQLKEGE